MWVWSCSTALYSTKSYLTIAACYQLIIRWLCCCPVCLPPSAGARPSSGRSRKSLSWWHTVQDMRVPAAAFAGSSAQTRISWCISWCFEHNYIVVGWFRPGTSRQRCSCVQSILAGIAPVWPWYVTLASVRFVCWSACTCAAIGQAKRGVLLLTCYL